MNSVLWVPLSYYLAMVISDFQMLLYYWEVILYSCF